MTLPSETVSPPSRKRVGCLGCLLRVFIVSSLLISVTAISVWFYLTPASEVTTNVVYGQRHGRDLVMDVMRPAKSNGLGIAFMASGGWQSMEEPFPTWMASPLLRRGYTVFGVRHHSQPHVTVPETVQDIHRALRFIRHHAAKYGVNPDRLGVTGASSGGHLSLMLATRGAPGDPDAPDPVDRQSSAVQAVAIFFPVTDLVDLGDSTQNLHDGGPPKDHVQNFGLQSRDPALWAPIAQDLSPILHIGPQLPPILIYHGTVDSLVPLDQSTRFQQKAKEAGHDVKLVQLPGKEHGWATMFFDLRKFADWFDENLGR